jgi:PHD/YefM family antitoxin component YafN of YafNO toxin-antitoxin module
VRLERRDRLVRERYLGSGEALSFEAEHEPVVITRHGKAAGVLIGFETEHDWFDFRLEHDPPLLDRVARARASLRQGRGMRLDDV